MSVELAAGGAMVSAVWFTPYYSVLDWTSQKPGWFRAIGLSRDAVLEVIARSSPQQCGIEGY